MSLERKQQSITQFTIIKDSFVKIILFNFRLAIHQAFNYWAQHSELNFKEVCQTCESELTIDFNEEDHKDGILAF